MRASELTLERLLDTSAEGGAYRFAGQRALLMDAVALGLLRKDLIETLGLNAARGVLTRFGYAHGWRTADSLRDAFDWANEGEWRRAGGRLHTLQGLVRIEAVPKQPHTDDGKEPFAQAIWRDSYEAEQHVLHLGRAEDPVCWTLSAYASGYLSRCNGRQILCIEEKCVGRGDAYCQLVGRAREDWGPEIEAHLPFYSNRCMETELLRVTEALKATERALHTKRQALRRAGVAQPENGFVAASERMRQVVDLSLRAAKVDAPVLILGENGVGKERVARLIHDESGRAFGPYVVVRCGGASDELLRSELFGYARSGSVADVGPRPGALEAAQGGTLLLDEVADLSLPMQGALLRALQTRKVRRPGESVDRPFDARLLCTSHRELLKRVRQGHFRQDLFDRLKVIELRVPPLRERPEDILPLARLSLSGAAMRQKERGPVLTLSAQAADALVHHPWPGNVRELENTMERAAALASGRNITLADLPEEFRLQENPEGPEKSRDAALTLAELERAHILATLARLGGDRPRVAEALGIGIATLYRKLKQYGEAP